MPTTATVNSLPWPGLSLLICKMGGLDLKYCRQILFRAKCCLYHPQPVKTEKQTVHLHAWACSNRVGSVGVLIPYCSSELAGLAFLKCKALGTELMDARSSLHLYEHKSFVLQGNTMHQHLTWPVLGLGLTHINSCHLS